MFKRYLLAITFCLSSIFFFSGILYSTTQKIIKLDTHSKNTTAFIVTQYTHNPLHTNYVQSILQYQQLAHTLQDPNFPLQYYFFSTPISLKYRFFLHRFINTSIFSRDFSNRLYPNK